MGRLTISRRAFLAAAAVTAAAGSMGNVPVALGDSDASADRGGEVKRIRSACRGCGKMECGVWVTVQNGRVLKTEGDESAFQSEGNHCAKGQASVQAAYHPMRLTHPLKRTNAKGEDPGWERISWDEAFETLSRKITELQSKYGNETYISMGGTSRIWSMATYSAFKACFGSPNAIQANEICKGPRFFATYINDCTAWSWMEVVGRPSVFVQWGGASELSNYDDSCRTTVDVAMRADTHILVDPRQTNLGKEADIWVNLRPGTDGAVANCWAQVIIERELYDDLYVRKWMNAPFLVVQEEGFEPTPCASAAQSRQIKTRLLKESDVMEGGSSHRFMVLNEVDGQLSWYDTNPSAPGWEGETWSPPIEGFEPSQPGLDATGQSQGFVVNSTPFPEGLYPALHAEDGGFAVQLKDGSTVHVRTVWEHYIDFLADFTPQKASEITGVDAEVLEQAAVAYATRVNPETGYGNGGLQYMLAPEHACNAAQNQRACDLLCGITGNMDVPGGMRGSTTGWPFMGDLTVTQAQSKNVRTYDPAKRLGAEKFAIMASDCMQPDWADATCVYDAINSGSPYKVTCGIGQTGDFMNQSNSLYACESLKKLDFWVSIDLWHTPTTDTCADLLLPAAHWLELDCMRKSQGSSGAFGATVKCIDPPGEAKSDLEIVISIFKAMGTPYCDGETDDEKWPVDDAARVCNNFGLTGFRIPEWEDFKEEFQKKGWFDAKVEQPQGWGTYRRYETGAVAPYAGLHPGWSTTTHKQEIWSLVFETFLPGQGEEFPKYVEPPHSPVADPDFYKDENAFTVTTGRRQGTYFHSEHRQLPWCRELWPVPRVEINPEDAARLGVDQGDWVWIENDHGKIRQVVDLYYGIAPGVVNCEHQWWFPELQQPDHGFSLSGVNCLVDPYAQDRIIGSSNLRAYGARIYKATPENSPFGNPVPCGDDGTPIIHTSDDPRLKEWMPLIEGREQL